MYQIRTGAYNVINNNGKTSQQQNFPTISSNTNSRLGPMDLGLKV